MKKVLIISYQYPPCASSGVYRILRFLKALPAKGWDPVVLTVQPEFYSKGIPQDLELEKKYNDRFDHDVHKTKMLPGVEEILRFLRRESSSRRRQEESDQRADMKSPSVYRKGWQTVKDFITISLMIPDKQNRWFFYALREAKRITTKSEINLIYAHGGPWTALVVATCLKKMTGLPLVIDFRDPWADNPYNDLNSFLRTKINKYLEYWCIKQADHVIANTSELEKLFTSKYYSLPSNKFSTITNGYDEDDYLDINFKFESSTSDCVSIVHTGTLYSKRSPLPFLLQVAELIRSGKISKKNIKIFLVGTIDVEDFGGFLINEGLEEVVIITGQVPRQKALEYVFSADILLLLQQGTALQIPAKIFEYVKSGKPMFAICDDGATKNIIIQNKLGLVADADNHEDIKLKFSDMFQQILAAKSTDGALPYSVSPENIAFFSSDTQSKMLSDILNRVSRD